MDDLIKRLEQASAGGRELDALIFCAVLHPDKKPTRNFHYTNKDEWGVFVSNQPKPGTTFYDAPHYTTSLDAALTLVPEGCDWYVTKSRDARLGFEAELDSDDLRDCIAGARTPALALCIVALKAIQAESQK